jgi:hypothetical protein
MPPAANSSVRSRLPQCRHRRIVGRGRGRLNDGEFYSEQHSAVFPVLPRNLTSMLLQDSLTSTQT